MTTVWHLWKQGASEQKMEKAWRKGFKRLRKALGLRQEDLAQRCGVSRQTIVAVENDKYDPTLPLARRLARELGTTVEELFHPE